MRYALAILFVLMVENAWAQVYERHQNIGNAKTVTQPRKASGGHD